MNIFTKIEKWAEKHKFWSDIVKGILAAFLIATIIEVVKNDVEYSAERKKAKLALKVDIIKEFAEKSYNFTSIAVRLNEAYEALIKAGNGGDSTEFKASKKITRDALDQFRSIEHQFDIAIDDSKLSLKADTIANMMKRIAGADTAVLGGNFANYRIWIKRVSDTIEIRALKCDL